MSTQQLSKEQKEVAAQKRIREFLIDLYGEEDMLIVRNTTNGIVSIGFGELGDKGGMPGGIPRSKLPIVLTDHFPRKQWTESADFRRAVAKGWLTLVSKDEYEKNLEQQRARAEEYARLAAKDKQIARTPQQNVFADDPDGEPQVIDPETSELMPAHLSAEAKRFAEYEGLELGHRPEDNTPEGVTVLKEGVSSRAISFCEEQKRGGLTSQQSIEWLDGEEKVLSDEDLTYVITNSAFDSVKSVARRILAERP